MTASSFVGITQGNTNSTAVNSAIDARLAALGTNTLVQVIAVHAGNGITGTVDVQPMVHQQDSDGNTTAHGTIYGVPYLRVQGGTCALIIDPVAGDIGYIIISGRDQTNAVANRTPSAPGSFRRHSMADCVYVGAFLGDDPEHYVKVTTAGVSIVTTGTATVQASSMEIKCDLKVDGTITATGDVKAGDISVEQHIHGGVQSGSSTTTAPE